MEKIDCCCDICELFRITKQRAGGKRDVIGVNRLEDELGVTKDSLND